MDAALHAAEETLGALRSEAGPTAEEARQTLRGFRQTATRADESLDVFAGTLRSHDDTRLTALRALGELTRTMQALRNLAEYLETHPEALLVGKEKPKEKRVMRIPRTTVVLLAFSALAGCVSLKRTAEPRYFALRPVAGTPPVAASVAPASADVALVVGVLPLALPGHLERPQFVSWIGPDEMRIDQFVRWAEPLASGALRVLADDLATVLPVASGDHGAVAGIGGAAVPRARGRRSLRPATGWGASRSPADSCCFRGAASAPSSPVRWTCGALPTPVPAIPRARSRP